jgi:endonuclease/exonuclease/phosphatase family metal-dependent hydrolase
MMVRVLMVVRVRIVLGVLVAAGVVAAMPVPALAAGTDRWLPLRVATYNSHHGAGPDGVLDLEHVAQAVHAMRVDVIGLQEVDRHWGERSAFVDQAAWLRDRLGMHLAYGANLDLDPLQPGQPRRQYGTAILSRHPILSWRNTQLPRFDDHEQRGLLEAIVNVRGTRVRVANTHLQHDNNLEREAQAARIVELLGADARRTVLVGDLNAVPGTPEIRTLTGVCADVWPAAGTGDGFTFPAVLPDRRIDYVLASPDVRPQRAEVPATDASDHLPVVADYLVRRGR